MELAHTLLTVSVIWGIAAVTPGPNFFITAHTAVGNSKPAAMTVVAGIVAGTLIWAVSGFLGISILFNTAPKLFIFIKLAGGTYLIYLGIKLIFAKKKAGKEYSQAETDSLRKSFRAGALTNLSNPKTAAFVTSLFATAMPSDATAAQGALSIALMCAISLAWYSTVVFLFSRQRLKGVYQRSEDKIKKAAGAIFVLFGLKLMASR